MERFSLTKWYLDCVDRDGRSAVAYWTELSWGPFRVHWNGVSLHDPGCDVVHRSSVAPLAAPVRDGASLAWDAPPLGCTVTGREALAPFSRRLLDCPDGTVDWCCEVPAASVTIAIVGQPAIVGRGYAERLNLTIAPWRLPIRQLRWGRWISDAGSRSLVWIDWQGAKPRTDVFLDGVAENDSGVEDDGVRAGSARLAISDRRLLHSRPLSSALASLGPLLSKLPTPWRGVEDAKWISRARLDVPCPSSEDGWCIDEFVRFPS
jgi:hypothetical protein